MNSEEVSRKIYFLLAKMVFYADEFNIREGESEFGIKGEFAMLYRDIIGVKLTYYRGEERYFVRRDDLDVGRTIFLPHRGKVYLFYPEFLDFFQEVEAIFEVGVTYSQGISFPVEVTFPGFLPLDVEVVDNNIYLLLYKLSGQVYIGRSVLGEYEFELTRIELDEVPLSLPNLISGKITREKNISDELFITMNTSDRVIIFVWDRKNRKVDSIYTPFAKEHVFCYDITLNEGKINVYCDVRGEQDRKLYFVVLPKGEEEGKIILDFSAGEIKRAFIVREGSVILTDEGIFTGTIGGRKKMLCGVKCRSVDVFEALQDIYILFEKDGKVYLTKWVDDII